MKYSHIRKKFQKGGEIEAPEEIKIGNPNSNDEDEKLAKKNKFRQVAYQLGTEAIDVADDALTGNKNFDSESQAIDSGVDMVSGALLKSGNPYAMAAGAIIKGVNAVNKALGQTVPGYNVNLQSSGFAGVSDQTEDASYRLSQTGKMDKMMKRRNQEVDLALSASALDEENTFQQQARMNSLQNVYRNNLVALSGGYTTDLLGA